VRPEIAGDSTGEAAHFISAARARTGGIDRMIPVARPSPDGDGPPSRGRSFGLYSLPLAYRAASTAASKTPLSHGFRRNATAPASMAWIRSERRLRRAQ
jgi:hypothetical protein